MGSKKRRFTICSAVVLGIAVLILIGFAVFQPQDSQAEETSVSQTRLLMDTVVDVRVDAPGAADLVGETFTIMAELEHKLSRFIETSDVARINQYAGSWVEVSSPTLELVEIAVELGHLTQGTFDVTIGAVLDLWGFGSDFKRVPTEDELAEALSTVDFRQIEIDCEGSRVRIPAGTTLDLGGIAKGFIVQKALQYLREADVSRAIVNAGGDISVIGKRPDGNPWRVGVQDPRNPSELRWIVPLEGQSIVTSGDYQRFFEFEGRRYHHILDPRSGYPAWGIRSVTVIGDDAVVCDAVATAIFILGWDEGREFALGLEGMEVIVIGDKGEWFTPGLEGKLIAL